MASLGPFVLCLPVEFDQWCPYWSEGEGDEREEREGEGRCCTHSLASLPCGLPWSGCVLGLKVTTSIQEVLATQLPLGLVTTLHVFFSHPGIYVATRHFTT